MPHHNPHHHHHHHDAKKTFDAANPRHDRVGAWFLGPKAENWEYMKNYLNYIIEEHKQARLNYYPDDQHFITPEMQSSANFQEELSDIDSTLKLLSAFLAEHSVPFWSPRYNGHMLMDVSMPAVLGYLTTTLFNPNNVATEASPFTTLIERVVGLQLCEMLGYNIDSTVTSEPLAWGHIACDGSVANLESMWAARNLKYYPLSLFNAIAPDAPFSFVADTLEVTLCTGVQKLFKDCTSWELLNLSPSVVLDLPSRMENEYGISSAAFSNTMQDYLIQTNGREQLDAQFKIKSPKYFVGTTKHYSWPKGAAITGIGSVNIIDVPVDNAARMDAEALDNLLKTCLDEQTAVFAVVAIMGSTEQGSVDPLSKVYELRTKYQALGLSFVIHADGAWGGYFASMQRDPTRKDKTIDQDDTYVPELGLQPYTENEILHYKYADSFTIDPHKSGYIPYPAGGLCYRDGRMRYLVTWTNPDVWKGSDGDDGMGVYGVEGSKPGAAPVAAWVSHEVIGLHKNGYGALLGEAVFSSVKMYSHWATMDIDHPTLVIVPFNMLPAEKEPNATPESIMQQRVYIRDNIVNRNNLDLINDPEASALLREMGSDLLINSFACNFKIDGVINDDIIESNYLNNRIYEELSMTKAEDVPTDKPLITMSTIMEQAIYMSCADNFKRRLYLSGPQDLEVLSNCVMSPFPTDGNFSKVVADAFQEVAERIVQECLFRNTITPAIHGFVMQGTDQLFLVHLPQFNMANYRYQLIITADIPPDVLERYTAAKQEDPSQLFTLATAQKDEVSTLLERGSFKAVVFKGLPDRPSEAFIEAFDVTNIRVIVNTPLQTKYLDTAYPKQMPFYLFGTADQAHIDHMLLHSPNVQITTDVKLELDDASKQLDLSKGLVAVMDNVPEWAMQPISPGSTPKGFVPGAKFKVTLYPAPTQTSGPGLTSDLGQAVASGNVTLGESIYVDATMINQDPVQKATKVRDITAAEKHDPDLRIFDLDDPLGQHPRIRKKGHLKGWKDSWNRSLASRSG